MIAPVIKPVENDFPKIGKDFSWPTFSWITFGKTVTLCLHSLSQYATASSILEQT